MSKKVNVCPMREQYKFRGACCVETCQYHTKTTPHHCMSLDRAEGDRTITAIEVGHYKSYALQRSAGAEPLSQKGKETALRRIQLQVREAIRLYLYVCYLDEHGIRSTAPLTPLMQTLFEELTPIVRDLREYMVPLLFDKDAIAQYAVSQRKGISSESFNFRLILGKRTTLTPQQFKELQDE